MVVLCTDVEDASRPEMEALAGKLAPDVEVVVTGEPLARDHPELARATVLCVSVHDQVTFDVVEAAPKLELVVTRSTGMDNVDAAACAERGVEATPLPEYATEAVAEMTVAGMTLLLRRGMEGFRRALGGREGGGGAVEGRWDRDGLLSTRLSDATVGVVGVGRIGRRVSELCVTRGATVLGYDIQPDPGFDPEGFLWTASLDQLLPRADVLTLHVPLDDSTRHMVAAEELAALPEGAVLVNTSRGPVVETGALVEALESGDLGGAYVDVLEGEPEPPLLEELLAHPNVLVTPHLAAYDERTVKDRYRLAARIVEGHVAGRPDG